MMPRTCDLKVAEANADKVAARNRALGPGAKPKRYGAMSVVIMSTDAKNRKVTFQARDPDGGLVLFVETWDDDLLFSGCPTTLPSVPGELPEVQASGVLFIEETVLKAMQIRTEAGKLNPQRTFVDPKWPDRLPDRPPHRPLVIFPTSIVVKGIEVEGGGEVTVDLLDAELAAPRQTIALQEGTIAVELTEKGWEQQSLVFPA